MAAVDSVRAIAYRASNPFEVYLRVGSKGLLIPVGGKIRCAETQLAAMKREWVEETEYTAAKGYRDPFFERVGVLEKPAYVLEYTLARYSELGFALPVGCDSSQPIVLWNPNSHLFACALPDGESPQHADEHDLRWFNLRTEDLKQIKSRYRGVMSAWRDKWLHGTMFPGYIRWDKELDSAEE